MTGSNPMAAFMAMQAQAWAAMAAAGAAMLAASARAPWLAMGDVTVYFPFGQGYSQDIDPRTNWVLARAAQAAPAADPMALIGAYTRQQELIGDLLVGLTDGPAAMDRSKIDELRAVSDQIAALKRIPGTSS